MTDKKKPLTLLEKMKQRAQSQKNYGGDFIDEKANVKSVCCPNCGAGRAKEDGLTHCAYCGHEFLSVDLSDGVTIKKSDNSK